MQNLIKYKSDGWKKGFMDGRKVMPEANKVNKDSALSNFIFAQWSKCRSERNETNAG